MAPSVNMNGINLTGELSYCRLFVLLPTLIQKKQKRDSFSNFLSAKSTTTFSCLLTLCSLQLSLQYLVDLM